MPYIETPNDLAEHIADLAGVYGTKADDDHPSDCSCRICFVIGMTERIRTAAENETFLQRQNALATMEMKDE